MRQSRREQAKQRTGEVIAQLRQRLGSTAAPVVGFAERFFERLAPEDVLTRPVETLYGAVLSLWKLAERRAPATLTVRVFNPKVDRDGWACRHTVVEMVNDDMPFLVDSVTMAIQSLGLGIHLLVHPVARIARDAEGRRQEAGVPVAESLMHLEIDEQTEADALERIEATIVEALTDVRAAVEDWRAMLAKVEETLAGIAVDPLPIEREEIEESTELLRWMADNHFTFLGFRDYVHFADGTEQPMSIVPGSGLGILRDPARHVMVGVGGFDPSTPEAIGFLSRRELLIITKANARSLVHRPALLDYIGIRRFDAAGNVVGERRFVGLFTSAAYNRNPRDIPLLRRKVKRTLERAGLEPQSHDGKALLNILETFPRDELFQVGEQELFEIAHGILLLYQRPRIGVFPRRDEFGRYVSVLVFAPRDRYDTTLRIRFGAILEEAYGGKLTTFHTQMGGDDPLARIQFTVSLPAGGTTDIDPAEIEARLIAAARSWTDDLAAALIEMRGEENGNRLFARHGTAFPAGYRDRFDPQMAIVDIGKIEAVLGGDLGLGVNLYRPLEAGEREMRFKLYRKGGPVALSDCLPMLEHMGFRVLTEEPFAVRPTDDTPEFWLHDFRLEAMAPQSDIAGLKDRLEEAFLTVWTGRMEDDGFNRLVLVAGLDWREVTILRAYCKYLRQAGIAFSQAYVEDALSRNARLARLLVDLFHGLFDPTRTAQSDLIATRTDVEIEQALEEVASLDEDRILRRFLNAIAATLRTNFYCKTAEGGPKDCLAIKLDSRAIDELPLPRPFVEVFVYSPRVEAIHLRGGKVARGGIRWSDRREDFRTEVLGLMKAQMVKNAVIVPVGAKGGFFPKRAPVEQGREAVQADAVECYKTFVRGLLDITDNRKGTTIVPPADVVRRDGDDPYLVVAADKGTATFSDIANGIAAEYGFWLGDAFASGGSAGYDHKKMGITARGAWELVKRHFRELGRDIQGQDFTAAGVGDMSGDVFGNGMLQSQHTRLIAAFDHRHIFVDPNPDTARAYAERKRLFDLPRSSWADYDVKLISKGGGVFDRKAKSLKLSPEIRRALGLEADTLTPNELIRAILTAEVDLLFNGGIGTYVKASTESHADVGDRANDAVRVDGRDIRAKVIGEGGNLGLTQRGRIEYALKGGRINTDAIDNSAGVDCSDHEVNIKILVDAVVADGELTAKQRERLLAEMTDEVGELVLRDNYLQGQALSVAEAQGARALPLLGRFMRGLERRGRLDRAVEFLPDGPALAKRQQDGHGMTRPELAVLLAYAKMALYDALLDSDLPEDSYFATDLARYFPRPLRKRFPEAIGRHRLRREIIATSVANSIINRAGITFVQEIQDEVEASAGDIARAYVATREIFGLRALWNAVEALDNQVPARSQIVVLDATAGLLRKSTLRLLTRRDGRADIVRSLQTYGAGIAELRSHLDSLVAAGAAEALAAQAGALAAQGLPPELARMVAAFPMLIGGIDVIDAANEAGQPVERAARIHFAIGEHLGLDWLRQAAEASDTADPWQRLAASAAVDELETRHRGLTSTVLRQANGLDPDAAVRSWLEHQGAGLERLRQIVAEFKTGATVDAARLAIANRAVRSLGA